MARKYVYKEYTDEHKKKHKVRTISRAGYENYLKAYDAKAESLAKNSYSMYTEKMSYAAWRQNYIAKKEELEAYVEAGKRKKQGMSINTQLQTKLMKKLMLKVED